MSIPPQNPSNPASEDLLSPEDMRNWAEREIKDSNRANALRIKDLTELAESYSSGAITAQQADELHSRYHHRWGEALPGVSASEGATDQEIVSQMDKARPFTGSRQATERYTQLFDKGRGR